MRLLQFFLFDWYYFYLRYWDYFSTKFDVNSELNNFQNLLLVNYPPL